MGQVNVNTPVARSLPASRPASSSAGFILGIIVAILVIAALVWFLVFNGGNGGNGGTDTDPDGATDSGNGDEVLPSTDDSEAAPSEAAPSGWILVTGHNATDDDVHARRRGLGPRRRFLVCAKSVDTRGRRVLRAT